MLPGVDLTLQRVVLIFKVRIIFVHKLKLPQRFMILILKSSVHICSFSFPLFKFRLNKLTITPCFFIKSFSFSLSAWRDSFCSTLNASSLIWTSKEWRSSYFFSTSLYLQLSNVYLSLYSSKLSISLSISAAWKRQSISSLSPINWALDPGSLAIIDLNYGR